MLPLTLISIRGQNTLFAGVALTAATLAWTAGSWIQARLASRQSRRLLTTTGLVLIALGIAGVASILLPVIPAGIAIVVWGVSGLGMGLAYSTISLVVLETAPTGQEGSATASMEIASVLGSALGTGLGGAIIGIATSARGAPTTGIALVDTLMIAIIAFAILTAIRLPGRRNIPRKVATPA